jgi:hypothetical protein
MKEVVLGQVFFPEYLSFPLSVSFHQCCILIIIIIIYTLLLPEGQTSEAWEPSEIGQ